MPKVEEQKEREMLRGEGGDYPWEETTSYQGNPFTALRGDVLHLSMCSKLTLLCSDPGLCPISRLWREAYCKTQIKKEWVSINQSNSKNGIVLHLGFRKRKWHSQRTALYHPRVIRLWQSNCLVWMGTGAQNHQLHVRMCMNTEGKTDTCMNTPTSVHINTYTYTHVRTYTFLPPKSCDIINSHLIPTARIYQKLCWHYMCVHDR